MAEQGNDRLQKTPILQKDIPFLPWESVASKRLPGIQPLNIVDWLVRDDAFAAQMALRDTLIDTRPQQVLATTSGARHVEVELLDLVLETLAGREGYNVSEEAVLRPDGVRIPVEHDRPMDTLGRLVQEDFCLLSKQDDEHVLISAALCFPASWSLDEKIGRPLNRIHKPVANYDDEIAKRVQRLFDAIRPDRPLWRVNAMKYASVDLFHPKREGQIREKSGHERYLRSEFQTLRRLPKSGAVVFGIHTYLVELADMPANRLDGMASYIEKD